MFNRNVVIILAMQIVMGALILSILIASRSIDEPVATDTPVDTTISLYSTTSTPIVSTTKTTYPLTTTTIPMTITTTTSYIPETEAIPPRYGFTKQEVYLLAQLLSGDKRVDGDGEYDIDFQKEINYYEVSKVLCVVMNRVNDIRFPNTVEKVVMQKNQFSVMPKNASKTPSDKSLQAVQEWCDAYDAHDISAQSVPENHIYFSGNGRTNTTRP